MVKPDPNTVDTASAQSFPASDPPPWTLGDHPPDQRVEHDTMGEIRVPREALYGAQTQRAVENFAISPHRLPPYFIRVLGLIKSCAAAVNAEMGVLSADKARRIGHAADQIADGAHYGAFVVDVFQTGSGTSTNMNANEVIARLTNTHPNDDVNRSQSSNDVFPSAIHVAAALRIHHRLQPAMERLRRALEGKASEFAGVHKIGRTHLQDATPMTLGQEFGGYAQQVRASWTRMEQALEGIYELPLGGTAVGTGVNAPAGFGARMTAEVARRTGISFRPAANPFEAQSARDAVLFLSGALKTYAVALGKIANDIRWLGSGPRAGLGELRLPAVQPGSSIMPGKVNPVIAESVLMVCAQVMGHDAAIAWSCAGGNFELNTMMPLMAWDLLDSVELLGAASENFAHRCVEGLEADGERAAGNVERSLGLAAGLAVEIGYDAAAAIAQEAWRSGESIREVARRGSGLSAERIDELLRWE